MNQTATPVVTPATLEVVPLGGLGEFGMNMMAVSWEDTTVLIDAGVMFPDPDQLGVDLIIPDFTYLESRRDRVKALVLTHGHEDHIGAVPHVMPLFDGPVYGTAMTLALVEPKLEEHGLDPGGRLTTVVPRQTVTVGPLSFEFIRVTHSMPDCVAVAITCPAGVVLFTGDFKIDQTPIDGQHFDLHRFAELGAQGVLALFSDSTNVDRKGFTGPEIDVIEAFEEIFTSTDGKLVVATFSSSIYRMQVLVDLAVQFERASRSSAEAWRRPPRSRSASASCGCRRAYSSATATCPTTRRRTYWSSRPARRASRRRSVAHRHRRPPLRAPGSRRHRRVLGAVDSRQREGHRAHHEPRGPARRARDHRRHEATCTCPATAPRRSSSWSCRWSARATSCRCTANTASWRSMPASPSACWPGPDGPFRCCWRRTATSSSSTGPGRAIADKAPTGRVLIDVTRVGEVGDEVLRDRRHLAGDGIIVAVVAISRLTGALVGEPELVARGFVSGDDHDKLFNDAAGAIAECIESSRVDERTDQGLMTEKLRVELRRFFKKRSGRRPLVLPVLMEI
jgi:ribonuclease J